MLALVLFFLGISLPTQALDTGYFYFGNTNLIGVGPIEDGEKLGQWKVFSRIDPENYPESSLFQADPMEFDKYFRKDFPLFIMNFQDGFPNGTFVENHLNGKPKVIANMQDGIFEGEYEEFYEGGELRLTGRVLGGKKEKEWKEYLESGTLISSIFYNQGVREGNAMGYYPEGNLKWEGSFKKGDLDGFLFFIILIQQFMKKVILPKECGLGNGWRNWKSFPAFIERVIIVMA